MKTRKELAQHVRSLDLLRQSSKEIAAWLQSLGQSGIGTREELIERLYRTIWRGEYD